MRSVPGWPGAERFQTSRNFKNHDATWSPDRDYQTHNEKKGITKNVWDQKYFKFPVPNFAICVYLNEVSFKRMELNPVHEIHLCFTDLVNTEYS